MLIVSLEKVNKIFCDAALLKPRGDFCFIVLSLCLPGDVG